MFSCSVSHAHSQRCHLSNIGLLFQFIRSSLNFYQYKFNIFLLYCSEGWRLENHIYKEQISVRAYSNGDSLFIEEAFESPSKLNCPSCHKVFRLNTTLSSSFPSSSYTAIILITPKVFNLIPLSATSSLPTRITSPVAKFSIVRVLTELFKTT